MLTLLDTASLLVVCAFFGLFVYAIVREYGWLALLVIFGGTALVCAAVLWLSYRGAA